MFVTVYYNIPLLKACLNYYKFKSAGVCHFFSFLFFFNYEKIIVKMIGYKELLTCYYFSLFNVLMFSIVIYKAKNI